MFINAETDAKNIVAQAADFKYNEGDMVEWSWQGGTVRGRIVNKTMDSFTVDGNEISGDEDEPVYKMVEIQDGEETGQRVAKPQSSLSKA
jgi:hypothetical protein